MFRFLLPLFAALALFPATGSAGNYGVSPLDVRFSPQQKSAVLTITSEDTKDVSLRLRAMRWTQDAEGRDAYEEVQDLVFFPKRLDIKPGEKRIVRVGVNELPAAGERAWRLYLEELAPPQAPGGGATRLAVLVNIGVPVFAGGADVKAVLRIGEPRFDADGRMELEVANSGTSRARLSRLVLVDGAVVTESLASRYVFPGISKRFTVALPKELCRGGRAKLRFETDTDNVDRDIELPTACR